MLTPKEKLYEIDSLIAANVSQIKHLRNLLNDPALVARQISDARARVDKAMAEIARIEHTQQYGWEMLDQHKERIAQLQRDRSSVVNAVGIEKMKAMFLEMQKLENSEPVNIAEIVQEIENEETEESEAQHDELDLPDTT